MSLNNLANLLKKMMESFRRVPVAAVLVVFTSIATVYWVLLGSSSLPRKRVRGPRGLANYGKACYLNAVLQALASSSIIQSWLSKSSSPLQQSLLKCLKVLNRQEDDPSEEVSPTYLFSALRFKIFFFQQISPVRDSLFNKFRLFEANFSANFAFRNLIF